MLFGPYYSSENFFFDSKIIRAFGLIIFTTIMLPFSTLLFFRMWRKLQHKIRWKQPVEIKKNEGN